ncbi:MAG: DUF2339 domain-containing protein, partial [Gammaproteobacteria bacterium]|nr:DUF2339 domain-containing protein [Gammaproteobacteria bacterium]
MNIMPLVFTVLAVAFGTAVFELEVGLLVGLVVGLIALQRQTDGKIVGLQHEITRLSERLAGAPQERPLPESDTDKQHSDILAPESGAIQSAGIPAEPDKILSAEVPVDVDEPGPSFDKPAGPIDNQPDNAVGALLTRTKQTIRSYFTDGNVFVRVGLLILFFGVAFLLKYAAENSRIPLELRFLGAAAGGFALLVAGWRLRNKKEIYALLLQGGGIGIIYITIFVSYRIANLIPSTLTFTLLVAFAVFTAALAVLQNSRTLAIYAVIGGFLAPFLASSGSGNYVGLFSYYAVLNAAILIIAWFKSWRLLNLIGFVFTFAVYALWFVFSYKTHMLIPAMGFLLLFFFMYSVIGVLYALKQTYNLKGLIDGTLVFGTPVIASSLLMAMVRHLEYGIALATVGIGFYYVLLARLLWNRSGDLLRLLAEAMLAIGVVFSTLAIPYSLDGHWSSAAWALEAAGILWISIRQRRRYAQWFAIVLQFGAGALFLLRNVDELGDIAWINPAFLGGLFIALGAFVSARLV